jgi:hypothetical protein
MEYTTQSKEIRADYLEYTLSGLGLPKAAHIRYEGRKIIDGASSKTKAFGFPYFVIFFDVANEYVKNIWIAISPGESIPSIDLIRSVLYTLGESHDFILIDWNTQELIDLRDLRQVHHYLMSYKISS